jgi:hypothetical protein
MRAAENLAPLLFVVVSLSACAVGEVTDVHPDRGQGEATAARGAYVPVRGGGRVSKTTDYRPGDGLTIYLNPKGGRYRAGGDDPVAGTSSVVASSGRSQVEIPAYGGSADWNELVQCVRDELAGVKFFVTDQRPERGPYVEVAVGGDGSELGMKGYAGVAPIDTAACLPIDRAVAFVFADGLHGLRGACEATVAEIGHVATLDHTFDCSDPMSYLAGCGDRHLRDADLECGELAARPCVCDRATQNPHDLLTQLVGVPEPQPPPLTVGCGDVTYAGSCSPEGVLTWCHPRADVRTLDCAAHQLACGDTGDAAIGNDCVPPSDPPPPPPDDACMGIDFLGQCSDAGVLSYCLDGALQTIDCAAIGQECTYVDDTLGYFCTNPPAPDNCGDVDFFGTCSADGNVLTYCLNGTLQVVDCSAQGDVCGLIDEVTGQGCIAPPPPPSDPPATPPP